MNIVRTIIRGDSYAIRRPLYTYHFVNDQGGPFDLTGCTVRTTYRDNNATPQEDPNDEVVVWKATLVVDNQGIPTLENGMKLATTAEAGTVLEQLSADASRLFPLGVELKSDIELTDAVGEKFTFLFEERIVAQDGVTHRRTD